MGKMYEKWKRKKANILLNTSHLSDHFSWHSFRFPLSVAELSNVNDWQLYFLIGKQLIKIFFLRFFSQEEKEIMFPENILSRNLSQQKRTRTLKTCHIIEFDRPSYFLSTPEISQYGEILWWIQSQQIFWFLLIFKLSKTCFQNVSYETLHFLHFKRITSEIHLTLNVTHRERASIW